MTSLKQTFQDMIDALREKNIVSPNLIKPVDVASHVRSTEYYLTDLTHDSNATLIYHTNGNIDVLSSNIVQATGDKTISAVVLGDMVTELMPRAFDGCTNLESVVFGSGLTAFNGAYCFRGCTKLKEVTYPENLTLINWISKYSPWNNDGTFDGCTSLSSVTINSKIDQIQACTFTGCTSLLSIHIPTNVTGIWNRAFAGTGTNKMNIQYIDFEEGSTLTAFGQSTFDWCVDLREIQLPNTLRQINKGTFWHCESLSSLDFGTNFTDIYSIDAFGCCYGLSTIIFRNTSQVVNLAGNAFSYDVGRGNYKVYVPDSLYENYLTAANWVSISSHIHKISELG